MNKQPIVNDPAGAAIVTGASRGLGVGVARRLAAAGHPVILAARDLDDLERATASIEELGHPAVAVQADVTREADVERVVAAAQEHFGGLAALVNNAGAPAVLQTLDAFDDWNDWRHNLEVDVRGAFNTMRGVAPVFRAQGGGTIVTLAAAAAGTAASPLHAAYSPAQAALLSLSRTTASWLAPAGVAVHTLCPSLTPAGGVGDRAAKKFAAAEGITEEEWIARWLGGKTISADDVGDAVVALLGKDEGDTWSVSPGGLVEWGPFPAAVAR
jgi:NAD(P)-dependent dehydrogenase (short-subunit alcohol dehydrogenase family)